MGYELQTYFSPCSYSYAKFDVLLFYLLNSLGVLLWLLLSYGQTIVCRGLWLSVDASSLIKMILVGLDGTFSCVDPVAECLYKLPLIFDIC